MSIFGENIYDEATMFSALPNDMASKIVTKIKTRQSLENNELEQLFSSLVNWAVSKGVTHFAHWFHPWGNNAAQRYDFLFSNKENENPISSLTIEKMLQTSVDAEAFPHGGLRSNLSSNGHCVTIPQFRFFILGKTLFLPSIFVTHEGDAVDNRLPLMKSINNLDKKLSTLLKLLDMKNFSNITTTVGLEYEYFLIDYEVYKNRRDIMLTGRSLFGAKQSSADVAERHYFGCISSRVRDFMADLNNELKKLGICVDSEHKEISYAQYEIVFRHAPAEVAIDNGLLAADLMHEISRKHGFVCLFHEKPFKYSLGNCVDVNWSMITDSGINLFSLGNTNIDNRRFLLLFSALITSIDRYSDLLIAFSSSAGFDQKIKSRAVPKNLISIDVGIKIKKMLDILVSNDSSLLDVKDKTLGFNLNEVSQITVDLSDKNRTSPLVFHGDKLEFRILGYSSSPSDIITLLNTMFAEVVAEYSCALEDCDNITEKAIELIKYAVQHHGRVIHNGDCSKSQWFSEAQEKGLVSYGYGYEAILDILTDKNIHLFCNQNIINEYELKAKQNAMITNYITSILIEARVFIDIVSRDIIPCIIEYKKTLLDSIKSAKALSIDSTSELIIATKLANLCDNIYEKIESTAEHLVELESTLHDTQCAIPIIENIVVLLDKARTLVDEAEVLVDRKYWRFYTYNDFLNSEFWCVSRTKN